MATLWSTHGSLLACLEYWIPVGRIFYERTPSCLSFMYSYLSSSHNTKACVVLARRPRIPPRQGSQGDS